MKSHSEWCLGCNQPWDDFCQNYRDNCYPFDGVTEGTIKYLEEPAMRSARTMLNDIQSILANPDDWHLFSSEKQVSIQSDALGEIMEYVLVFKFSSVEETENQQ